MITTTSSASAVRSGVRTLRAAHEVVNRRWPGRDASDSAWLDYHQPAAALYDAVAETDREHHHEALYWAHQERAAARLVGQPAGIAEERSR